MDERNYMAASKKAEKAPKKDWKSKYNKRTQAAIKQLEDAGLSEGMIKKQLGLK